MAYIVDTKNNFSCSLKKQKSEAEHKMILS